jgi:hypothetical protein
MSFTVADLVKNETLSIPKTIVPNKFEEFIGKIVFIYPFELEGKEIPSVDKDGTLGMKTTPIRSKLGRLLSIKDNVCKFENKDGRTFRIDRRDIKNMELFKSANYRTQN